VADTPAASRSVLVYSERAATSSVAVAGRPSATGSVGASGCAAVAVTSVDSDVLLAVVSSPAAGAGSKTAGHGSVLRLRRIVMATTCPRRTRRATARRDCQGASSGLGLSTLDGPVPEPAPGMDGGHST
jgi:hypothetical protein